MTLGLINCIFSQDTAMEEPLPGATQMITIPCISIMFLN